MPTPPVIFPYLNRHHRLPSRCRQRRSQRPLRSQGRQHACPVCCYHRRAIVQRKGPRAGVDLCSASAVQPHSRFGGDRGRGHRRNSQLAGRKLALHLLCAGERPTLRAGRAHQGRRRGGVSGVARPNLCRHLPFRRR